MTAPLGTKITQEMHKKTDQRYHYFRGTKGGKECIVSDWPRKLTLDPVRHICWIVALKTHVITKCNTKRIVAVVTVYTYSREMLGSKVSSVNTPHINLQTFTIRVQGTLLSTPSTPYVFFNIRQAAVGMKVRTRIGKLLGSISGRDTGYLDSGIFVFFFTTLRQMLRKCMLIILRPCYNIFFMNLDLYIPLPLETTQFSY
jgi:hypothetical protein